MACRAWPAQLGLLLLLLPCSASVSVGRGSWAHRDGRAAIRLRGGATDAQEDFDYVIVGGGAAGCVLANRLSADPAIRVLLLEAGEDATKDMRVRVPAAAVKLFKSSLDWDYESAPSDGVNHQVYLCRGKALGGSSSTNVMLYHRGSAADHDAWVDAGASGWGAKDCLPYYRKAEDYFDGESQYHGSGGPTSVEEVPYQNPLSKAFLKATGSLGYRPTSDFNDWSAPQEGYGRYKVTQKNGERCSTAVSYLALAKGRPNLCVRTGAHVTKLALDDSAAGRAACTAVEYVHEGAVRSAGLAKGGEALLCAGAVQSPQVLMVSGIGPRDHLEQLGIPVRVDLAGVGEGLQDHPAVLVSYSCTKRVSVTDELRIPGTSLPSPTALLKWLLLRRGPMTSVACDHGGFFRTSADAVQPDLQARAPPTEPPTHALPHRPSHIEQQHSFSSRDLFSSIVVGLRCDSSPRARSPRPACRRWSKWAGARCSRRGTPRRSSRSARAPPAASGCRALTHSLSLGSRIYISPRRMMPT